MNVRTRWFAGTAAAALLVVVGVACGGSNGNGEATQTSTPSPTEMAAPDAAALRALLARTEGRTFQATYDAVLTGNEVSGSGTVVLAQDGGRAATRLTLDERDGIPFSEVVLIAEEEKTTACFGDGDRGTCLKSTGDVGEAFANPLDLDGMLARITGDEDVKRLPDETVEGFESQCYQAGSGQDEGIACFATDNGVPTRLDATSDGAKATLRVREIGDSVDRDVFDTPDDYVTLGR